MQFLEKGRGVGLAGILIFSAALAGCNGDSNDSSSGATSNTSSATPSAMGTIVLSSANYQVLAASSAIITVYRSGTSSSGSATVGYSTIDGSADAGADYSATSGTLTWAEGDTSARTVLVPVTALASGKNFAFALTSVQGEATFGEPAAATVAVEASAASGSSGTTSASTGSSSSSGGTSASTGSSSSSGGTSAGTGSSSSGGGTNSSVTLAWSAPTENSNGTALTNLAGYNIYYGSSTSAMTNKISVKTVGVTDYVITELASGSWYFTLTSVNSQGAESVASNTVAVSL